MRRTVRSFRRSANFLILQESAGIRTGEREAPRGGCKGHPLVDGVPPLPIMLVRIMYIMFNYVGMVQTPPTAGHPTQPSGTALPGRSGACQAGFGSASNGFQMLMWRVSGIRNSASTKHTAGTVIG